MTSSDISPDKPASIAVPTIAQADVFDDVRLPKVAQQAEKAASPSPSETPPRANTTTSDKSAAPESHLPELSIAEPGKTVRESARLDGQDRQYFLHLPKDYDPGKSYPLVMVFNGWGNHTGQGGVAGGGEGMEKTTGLSERADQDGFIVAYMDGSPRDQHSWNNGQWFFSKENDVKFTSDTMDQISRQANVDQSRIYLAGYSQGGSFAHRAAAELSDRIAAVATVGGWLTGKENTPKEDVSVLEIHAGKDPTVPYDGRRLWLTMKPHEYLQDFYLKNDKMPSEHETTTISTSDGSTAVSEDWRKENGTEVKMITLPQVNKHEYYGGFGATVSPVNVTDQFLEFFKDHKREK